MHTYDCGGRSGEKKIRKQTNQGGRSVVELQRKRHSLFIEGAATAGGGAVLKEGLCEFLVEIVCHRPRDPLPCQDEDHQHSSVTEVPGPPTDQTQQLLLFTVTPNHLSP